MATEPSKEELLGAQMRVWNCAFGYVRTMSLLVAVQLGIPDAIHGHRGHMSLRDLASAVGIPGPKVPALRRLMRALSHAGFFNRRDVVVKTCGGEGKEVEEEAYLPTVFSQQLVRDSPTAAAQFLLVVAHPLLVTPWYSMATWFRGEDPAGTGCGFEAAHGETLWESRDRVADFDGVIDGAMASDSWRVLGQLLREYPGVFRGLASLVDVGGGNGTSAKAIKEVFPKMRCTVLEVPHVVAASPPIEGVDFVAGDMFEHVPPADAALLKWVLQDWNDEDCVRILRRCKEAIPAKEQGGKVIIIEIVVGRGGVSDGVSGGDHELEQMQHLFDLFVLAVTGGKQRDEGEWRQMFAAAGFSDCKITPGLGSRSIIEVYP